MHRQLTRSLLSFFLVGLLTAGAFGVSQTAQAADEIKFIPELDIPGQFSGEQIVDNNLFGRYIRAIYIYFIWIVGIVATGMVVFAGVKWVAAAGNAARISDARDMMNNAIIGVVIALTSVVLLNLLSPSFTTLSIPGTKSVSQRYFDGAQITRVCKLGTDGVKDDLHCGRIVKTGTKEDRNGDQVDVFCMGTVCDSREVCQISQNAGTKLYNTAGGCVSKVEIVNPPTEFKTQTSLPVIFGDNNNCGSIHKDFGLFESQPFSLNWGCEGISQMLNNGSACYMLSARATIIGSSEPYKVQGVQCP